MMFGRRGAVLVGLIAVVALVVGVVLATCAGPGRAPTAGSVTPPAPAPPVTAPPASGPPPSAPAASAGTLPRSSGPAAPVRISSWAYQLQGYAGGRLDQIAAGPYQLAVVDLARDAHADYFRADEIRKVRGSGKRVLAYFEIGSIEEFRPEYPALRRDAGDLIANEWDDWPGEYFVRYWDERWWERVIRGRVDQALKAGFDGVYLDTPLAYEEIDPAYARGRDREALGAAMAALIARISAYAKARRPGFLIVPQNSPELRRFGGYTRAIDGIAMEELFYRATDEPCTEDFCTENLADTRALRDAGKFVLSVDYATRPADIRSACGRYRNERFAGTVTVLELDRLTPPCT
ncbi:endo alpha-1,4 polygalactosaminidase [Actinoplanes sp. NPDC026623]|uniref:endo alpha-1,4 polygalactosaminidase n=1 Tax=Actinoplanes sp. NPDC026623 TaxID=3155610 RepID=UPI0033DA50C4